MKVESTRPTKELDVERNSKRRVKAGCRDWAQAIVRMEELPLMLRWAV